MLSKVKGDYSVDFETAGQTYFKKELYQSPQKWGAEHPLEAETRSLATAGYGQEPATQEVE